MSIIEVETVDPETAAVDEITATVATEPAEAEIMVPPIVDTTGWTMVEKPEPPSNATTVVAIDVETAATSTSSVVSTTDDVPSDEEKADIIKATPVDKSEDFEIITPPPIDSDVIDSAGSKENNLPVNSKKRTSPNKDDNVEDSSSVHKRVAILAIQDENVGGM